MTIEVDQTTYVHRVRRVEIDKVKSRYGLPLVRIRIKGDSKEDGISLTLWGEFDNEECGPEVVVSEIDESQPLAEASEIAEQLEDEEPDV